MRALDPRLPVATGAAAALLAAGCTTTHGIRPVGKGAVAVETSLGGPITEVFGAPVPLPISALGATWGATDRVDVHASIHPTGAALFGVYAGDIGVSGMFLAPSDARPRLMADFTTTVAGGDRDAAEGKEGGVRAFFQPSVTASWDWGGKRRSVVYTGLTAFLEPADALYGIGGIYAGNRFSTGPRSHVAVELKWLQPWADNEPIVPEFAGPGHLGAVALQFGYGITLRGRPE